MLRRSISVTLAVAVLLYVGCHDTTQITRDRFLAKKPSGDILVLTKDVKYYRFAQNTYWVIGDSLKGSGTLTDHGRLSAFSGSIPLSDIDLVEIDELNAGKTVAVVLGVSAAIALLAIGFFVVALGEAVHSSSEHSCPFVYTYDGANYHFESETFSGAVLKGLERTNYDVLHYLKPVGGTYLLKITNERTETQYVNELKLLAVDHSPSVSVIPDMRGTIHTISHLSPPVRCTDFSNRDALGSVAALDSLYWESDLSSKDFKRDADLTDGLDLEFEKPAGATLAKLVVNGINTELGDFAFTKLFQLAGDNKLGWYQQLERDSSERATFLSWMMREGMLHVKVWNGLAWQERAALLDGGPALARDQIALLDVRNIPGPILKVRLESTTDLWRIDRVSIDYSADLPVAVTELSPASAINERGVDMAKDLSGSDDKYYVTIPGQHADLRFTELAPRTGMARSYVLKTRGFYYQWIDAQGPEKTDMLRRVLTEPRFGQRQYLPEWKKARVEYGALRK